MADCLTSGPGPGQASECEGSWASPQPNCSVLNSASQRQNSWRQQASYTISPMEACVGKRLFSTTGQWFSRTECRAATNPDFRHTACFHIPPQTCFDSFDYSVRFCLQTPLVFTNSFCSNTPYSNETSKDGNLVSPFNEKYLSAFSALWPWEVSFKVWVSWAVKWPGRPFPAFTKPCLFTWCLE